MTTKTKQMEEQKVKKIVLSEVDTKEIEKTFSEASDFRAIWEVWWSEENCVGARRAVEYGGSPFYQG